jgi:hypothetical protein
VYGNVFDGVILDESPLLRIHWCCHWKLAPSRVRLQEQLHTARHCHDDLFCCCISIASNRDPVLIKLTPGIALMGV